MRFFFVPENLDEMLPAIGLVAALIVGVLVWQWLWPPRSKKLLADARYQHALGVYAGLVRREEPTAGERAAAVEAATAVLTGEYGVPAEEARVNLPAVLAAFDKEWSVELRQEALGFEQGGLSERAATLYELAALVQEPHDAEDRQFLLGCAERARRKGRRG